MLEASSQNKPADDKPSIAITCRRERQRDKGRAFKQEIALASMLALSKQYAGHNNANVPTRINVHVGAITFEGKMPTSELNPRSR